MKKHLILAAVLALSVTAPAFAQSSSTASPPNNNGAIVNSDVNAEAKDNAAISHDNSNLAQNRAAKAADKANGNWAGQAVDSVKIGANQAAKTEKSTEKSADHSITNYDSHD